MNRSELSPVANNEEYKRPEISYPQPMEAAASNQVQSLSPEAIPNQATEEALALAMANIEASQLTQNNSLVIHHGSSSF